MILIVLKNRQFSNTVMNGWMIVHSSHHKFASRLPVLFAPFCCFGEIAMSKFLFTSNSKNDSSPKLEKLWHFFYKFLACTFRCHLLSLFPFVIVWVHSHTVRVLCPSLTYLPICRISIRLIRWILQV